MLLIFLIFPWPFHFFPDPFPLSLSLSVNCPLENADEILFIYFQACNVQPRDDCADFLDVSLEHMKTECDGKNMCTVMARSNPVTDGQDPCGGQRKYLEAKWVCLG